MTLFSESAIASLRALNVAALESRAQIGRPGRAASPGGGANTGKPTWDDVADDVPCRLSTMEGVAITSRAGQLTTADRLLAVFDLGDPVVKQGDRLTITGTDAAGNDWTRVVVVLSARNPRTFSAMRVFVCEESGPGAA